MDPFPKDINKSRLEEIRAQIPMGAWVLSQASIIMDSMISLLKEGTEYCLIDLSEAGQVIRRGILVGLAARFDRIDYFHKDAMAYWKPINDILKVINSEKPEEARVPDKILVWLNYHSGAVSPLNPEKVTPEKKISYRVPKTVSYGYGDY